MSVTIYGSSDDLIEIEGDVSEEFTVDDEVEYLAFSNGALLSITYGADGRWSIRGRSEGTEGITVTSATDPEEDYSDRAVVHGQIDWVVCGRLAATVSR